jgi:Dyp-type peroxidase family
MAELPVIEPVLPLSDIQGIAVPGFFKPYQTLLGIACPNLPAVIANFKTFLGELANDISTGEHTLKDRRRFREFKIGKRAKPTGEATTQLTAVGFTFPGLQKLTPGAAAIPSPAFQQGLATRSHFLGDPPSPGDEGHPDNWKVGGPNNAIDMLLIIAGDSRPLVDKRTEVVAERLGKAGLQIVYREKGGIREDEPGHEHFGFDDGVSQPGIRGRASDDPEDFITDRRIAKHQHPEYSLFGYPGQDLVWPGVLVLGHPATSPDPLIPGVPSPAVPDWTRNGSFLVFRRLRQDVGLFWRTMRDEAGRLAALPGFEGMTDVKLASRIVGRWPSGAPVNRVPDADDPKLGENAYANNHFRFDSDTAALPLETGHADPFPQATADPAGITCPWSAHIRKLNTRDSGADTGGRDATYAKRLLRVGVPFGTSLVDRYAEKIDDPEKGERGLLFLSIQASIEDQFEFLMVRWMGDSARPKMPGGHDILMGQNDTPGENRVRRCVLFGSGVQQATVATAAQWIVPTGGGYFFVPSLTALREVLAK